MTADNRSRSLVPYDWFDIAELLNTSLEFLVLGIARSQVLAWIVLGGFEFVHLSSLYFHSFLLFWV